MLPPPLSTSSSFSSTARRQAAHILSQPPFTSRPTRSLDPLGGVLHTVGRWIRDALRPLSWLWDHISSSLHGVFGSSTAYVLGAFGVAVGAGIAVLLVRRRSRHSPAEAVTLRVTEREDASVLERAAAEAEAGGDLDGAVRLRFRAGLARLEAAGIIASRLVTTTDQVRQRLRNDTFDDLAHSHETIVYAGRHASARDAAEARERWPRLLDDLRHTEGESTAGSSAE